ncbi:MAG: hypothetical protein UR20_C0008G0002 [Candidatus Woesebacteria bacterium GW2011_GWE2_31_6]|nr:MAG: hypothetical protein UR20_C0008G0002 [Candidatus Woesebacteria bacterium GW2011_GWE2_31_6]
MTFSVEIANILNESGFFSQYIISQDCTYVRDGKVQQDGNYTLRDTEEGVIERMVNLDQVLKHPRKGVHVLLAQRNYLTFQNEA